MKEMNEQVLSIEQMQHLKELGVDISKATMYWLRIIRTDTNEIEHDWYLGLTKEVPQPVLTIIERKLEVLPAFTLQDILELLPYKIDERILTITKDILHNEVQYFVKYEDVDGGASPLFIYNDLIGGIYEMLCWCIENNYGKLTKK